MFEIYVYTKSAFYFCSTCFTFYRNYLKKTCIFVSLQEPNPIVAPVLLPFNNPDLMLASFSVIFKDPDLTVAPVLFSS